MNKDYLNSLSKDQLENRIYDLNNELNQEWHLERIMKLKSMSRNYLVQAHLEYLVEEGLKKGLTEKQAIDYANNIFFSKGDNK